MSKTTLDQVIKKLAVGETPQLSIGDQRKIIYLDKKVVGRKLLAMFPEIEDRAEAIAVRVGRFGFKVRAFVEEDRDLEGPVAILCADVRVRGEGQRPGSQWSRIARFHFSPDGHGGVTAVSLDLHGHETATAGVTLTANAILAEIERFVAVTIDAHSLTQPAV